MEITEKVYPSDANFLLVKVKNANSIYNKLIEKNIIVRNRSSVIENCIRITVGRQPENNKLINALNNIQYEESTIH
jgi:histidinol-phosphate aminotransferase